MFNADVFKSNDIYDFLPPKGSVKGFLSIPHAGEDVPNEFKKYLTDDTRAMMEDVDYRVHELIDLDAISEAGIAISIAKVHRYCVDLNRAPEVAVLNWKINTKEIEIVKDTPSVSVSRDFVNKYHASYYNMLDEAVKVIKEETNKTVPFIDLHSMPSAPTAYHLKLNPDQKMERADFCVSDLPDHSSCVPEFIKFVCDKLTDGGYAPAINDPYFGGFVTKYVNTMDTNNIQIEINRRIYMDETKKELVPELVEKLKPVLTEAIIKTLTKF